MKTFLPFFLLFSLSATAQTTVVKANFQIDGELKAGTTNGNPSFPTAGDDWYILGMAENATSKYVIDTTGAAAIVNLYTNPANRNQPFFRSMRLDVKPYDAVGIAPSQRTWIDGVMIRDYINFNNNDQDLTGFIGSNKNAQSPADWVGGPDNVNNKTDIEDIMVHVRRAGTTATSNLWFYGGLSRISTSGAMYFDFELYQTDIFYSRLTQSFTGYGPDEGHTTWRFDASGNITAIGDVIFAAKFGTSGLDSLEARIWIDRASMSINPVSFDWVAGSFDGATASSQYGYAAVKPNGTGAYYFGQQSINNAWPGPFGFIDAGKNFVTKISASQFLEFGVDLTYLGLDPMTILGGGACGLPFRRILVKSRVTQAFQGALSDFVGPFDFFRSNPVDAVADVPYYCGSMGVSQLTVTSPSSASVYTWSTDTGNIISGNTGPTINVDAPGTYVVTQQLLDGCAPNATDTVRIVYDAACVPMAIKIAGFRGNIKNKISYLSWETKSNEAAYFEIQRSTDGRDFQMIGKVSANPENLTGEYAFDDNVSTLGTNAVYYRLKIRAINGSATYSSILKLGLKQDEKAINVFPNPVKDLLQLSVPSSSYVQAHVSIYDMAGALLRTNNFDLREGINILQIDASTLKPGTYMVNVTADNENVWKKFVVSPTVLNK